LRSDRWGWEWSTCLPRLNTVIKGVGLLATKPAGFAQSVWIDFLFTAWRTLLALQNQLDFKMIEGLP